MNRFFGKVVAPKQRTILNQIGSFEKLTVFISKTSVSCECQPVLVEDVYEPQRLDAGLLLTSLSREHLWLASWSSAHRADRRKVF